MYSIITAPSASNILSSTTAYSATLFTDFLDVVWIAVGVTVAVLAALYVKRVVSGGASRLLGGRRKRGLRRR